MPKIPREYIYEHYIVQEKSFDQMEKECGVKSGTLRYHAKKYGIPLRGREEAQRLAQKHGRSYNPCEGKSLSPEHREAIARTMAERFANMTDEEKEKLSRRNKELAQRDPERMRKFTEAGQKSLKTVAKRGSNLEHHLAEKLTECGYKVYQHRNHMIANENMHVDLMLEKERIAIELDGPQHWRIVYGVEDLKRKKEKDMRKNGLLMQEGYNVIRYGIERARSIVAKQNVLNEILEAIESLDGKTSEVVYLGEYKKGNNNP